MTNSETQQVIAQWLKIIHEAQGKEWCEARQQALENQIVAFQLVLRNYDAEQLTSAFDSYFSSPNGRFIPTPSHIIMEITGTERQAVDMAMANCLTKWELNNLTPREQDRRRDDAARAARVRFHAGDQADHQGFDRLETAARRGLSDESVH